jgi:release factor glutamine methyltransferase
MKPDNDVGTLIRTSGIGTVDATILLISASGLTREQLITHDGSFEAAVIATYQSLCLRRAGGEPVAYLTGQREFYGRRFQVTPDVLIPRPETELLVELALQRIPDDGAGLKLLDLGTGSGSIAISMACERLRLDVTATDISGAALALAAQNAQSLGAQVQWLESDWFAALDMSAPFDLILANPPYIAAGDVHLESGDLRHEPRGALTDGADGLSALRRIISGSVGRLKPGGHLLLEHGHDQAQAVRSLLEETGFKEVRSWRDLASIERVSGGQA